MGKTTAKLSWAFVLLFVAALMLAALAQEKTAPAKSTTRYLRIRVSPKERLYIQLRGKEMRMAKTPAGLETAPKPILASTSVSEGSEYTTSTFPPFALPGTSNPPTLVAISYTSYASGEDKDMRDYSYAQVQIVQQRKDSRGTRWGYISSEYADPTDAPVSAPEVKVPVLGKLKLELTADTKKPGEVGLGVVVNSGKQQLDDITRNGKSMSAQVKLVDSKKKPVASKTAALGEFGFG
jgi:hypothetical protein